MKTRRLLAALVFGTVLTATTLADTRSAHAHCDSLDGPVVKAAEQALLRSDPNLVLPWVRKGDEAELRSSFQLTSAVRKLGPDAAKLADTSFFETVVRIHRAGEGAPYTGLKPAGRDVGPAIPAADRALVSGSVEPLVRLVSDTVQAGIRERFRHTVAARTFDKDDVESGRKYVEQYVEFVHYVERLYGDATASAEHHAGDVEQAGHAR